MGGPAAVDGQDDAGEIAGRGVGEQQGGAGELGGLGPPADRDLGGQEVPDSQSRAAAGGADGSRATRRGGPASR